MTYFSFLIRFLAIPLSIFLVLAIWNGHRGKSIPGFQDRRIVWFAIGLHVLLALVYTTPWDNYLVATGVWAYAPKLVSGLVFGWVPVEEYVFFILETLLTGLWWWFLALRLSPPGEFKPSRSMRWIWLVAAGLVWAASLSILFSGWRRGVYLALILAWALPAMASQIAFGADILWHYRKLVILTVLPMLLYLSMADAFAIRSGIWRINPARSTGILLGALPIEEAIFFLVTVMLIDIGLTLALSRLSQRRWRTWGIPLRR